MPPRNTLAWEVCEICGRHSPTTKCSINGRRLKLCIFCFALFGNKCGEKATKTALSPNEKVIENITKEVISTRRTKGRKRTRRYR